MNTRRTAWVVGATGFWGRNVVLSLLRRNWRVVAISRTEPLELIAWAESRGAELVWHQFDLSDMKFDMLPLGAPEALFSCASVLSEDLQQMMAINTIAPILLVERVLQQMIERGSGRIGIFLGQNGRVGIPQLGDFSATQAALWTWAEARERSLHARNVTISLVFPPRAPSRLQRALGARLPAPPKVSSNLNADDLVAAVLDGRKRAGRRPWLAFSNSVAALV